MKQPEALRLADALSSAYAMTYEDAMQAAAELRRLHEVNVQLTDTLKEMVEAFQHDASLDNPSLAVARAALAKAQGEKE